VRCEERDPVRQGSDGGGGERRPLPRTPRPVYGMSPQAAGPLSTRLLAGRTNLRLLELKGTVSRKLWGSLSCYASFKFWR